MKGNLNMYDILIVGGGPAGLSAAIYARRSGKSVLVVEKAGFGGQMALSPKVENYAGFASISGAELADKMLEQALGLGAEIEFSEVLAVEDGGAVKTVRTEDGDFKARAVILAAGVRHRKLGLPDEEELIGSGVSFCAVCDGAFYAGKTVAVIGGGNSALQEALLLAQSAENVIVCHRREFTADQALQDALDNYPNIACMNFVRPEAFLRNEAGALRGLRLAWTQSGESFELSCEGVFEAVGLEPENGRFPAACNAAGYLLADAEGRTDIAGIFAAGDCREKSVRQIATAVADGAVAALAAAQYIDGIM